MFRTKRGELCVETERIAQRIKEVSEAEVELDERRGILRDALTCFEARLEDMPERERTAALSLLYKDLTDRVFDFTLSIVTTEYRQIIAGSRTVEEKKQVLEQYKATLADLAMLHGIT